MRHSVIVLAAALAATGCTTQAPAPSVTYAATDAPAATTVEQAQKMGYRLVDDHGRTLYCREWRKLGSHIQKERVCLTEEEFEQSRSLNQRTFEMMKAPGPIPYEGPAPRPRGQ